MQQNLEQVVQKNIFKGYLYMVVLTTFIVILGSFLSSIFNFGLTGTGIFLIIAGIIDFVAYFFSDTLIIKSSRAKKLTKEIAPEYFKMVEELTHEMKLPFPKLYYLDTNSMNAFATGRDPKHAAVVVTRGLLEKMELDEVKGVLGHELSHVKNYDTRLMAIVAILAGLISILADAYWYSSVAGKAGHRDRSGIIAFISLFFVLIAPLSAMLIQLSISRKRELLADAFGAQSVKNPTFLASALKKISLDQTPLPHNNLATAHLYISNPLKSEDFLDRLFSTHPPVEERISILNTMKV